MTKPVPVLRPQPGPTLSWRREVRSCLTLALPLSVAQVAQAATGFVDTVMMGALGSESLAAGGLGATLFMFAWLMGSNMVSVLNPLVAEAHGANAPQRIRYLVEQGIWLVCLLSIPMTLVLYYPAALLRWSGQDPALMAIAIPYLRAIAWGYCPALLFVVFRSFVSALSQPKSVLVIMMGAVGVNAIANYGLIFGKWGLPALGVAGAGWASTITYWAMAIAMGGYVLWHPPFRLYRLLNTVHRLRLPMLTQMITLGLPMGLMALFETGLFSASTLLAGQLGTINLAAHHVALQTVAMTFMVPLGISFATTVKVGQYWGRRDLVGAKRAGYVGIGLGISFMAMMAIALIAVPRSIIALYLDITAPENQAVVELAISLLAVGGMFQLVDGIQVIAAGALRGLQDTKMPMIIGALAYWGGGLTISYLAAFRWGFGGVGLWSGLALGLAIAATCLTWRFQQRLQHLANTHDHTPPNATQS